jgi:hypothetical protein
MPGLLSLPLFNKNGSDGGGSGDGSGGTSVTNGNTSTENKDNTGGTSASTNLASLLDKLGNALDFGVVAVWSCPNSCAQSFYEYVVVQGPPDIGI